MLQKMLQPWYEKNILEKTIPWLQQHLTPKFVSFVVLVFGLGLCASLGLQHQISPLILWLLASFLVTVSARMLEQLEAGQKAWQWHLIAARLIEVLAVVGLSLYAPSRLPWCLAMLAALFLFAATKLPGKNQPPKSLAWLAGLGPLELFLLIALMILLPGLFGVLALLYILLLLAKTAMRLAWIR